MMSSSDFTATLHPHISSKCKAVGVHPYLPLCAVYDDSKTITVFDYETHVEYLRLPPSQNANTVISFEFFGEDTKSNNNTAAKLFPHHKLLAVMDGAILYVKVRQAKEARRS